MNQAMPSRRPPRQREDKELAVRLLPDSGTRWFILSRCSDKRAGEWVQPIADDVFHWAMRARVQLNGEWWHALAVETNTGSERRGLRWTHDSGGGPARYRHKDAPQFFGDPDSLPWRCEACGAEHVIRVHWMAQNPTVAEYDLVVDLGTSRTSAVLVNCDQGPGGAARAVAPLPFWPPGYSGDSIGEEAPEMEAEDYAVVPSIAFVYPNLFESAGSAWEQLLHEYRPDGEAASRRGVLGLLRRGGSGRNGRPPVTMRPIMFFSASPLLLSSHSPTRETASMWNRLVNAYAVGSPARSLQPAPKRYLAHEKSETWGYATRSATSPQTAVAARLMHPEGAPYDWRQDKTSEVELPPGGVNGCWSFQRSGALLWFCLAVLERAWEQIQSDWIVRYFDADADPSEIARRLRRVVAIAPPGWPPSAKRTWYATWQRAIDLFSEVHVWSRDGTYQGPKLSESQVDEAFSAQFPFVSAMIEGGAESLPTLCRILNRRDRQAREFRIMTIDVGGGTTDLSVCRYRMKNDFTIEASTELSHSSPVAGDEVVFNLLDELIIPARLEAIPDEDVRRVVRERLAAPTAGLKPGMLRTYQNQCYLVFPPLAHLLLERMAESPEQRRIRIQAEGTEAGKGLGFISTFSAELRRHGLPMELGDDEIEVDAAQAAALVVDVLGPVLRVAAQQIEQHQVDLVMLSGKLTEIGPIYDLIVERLPILPGRIIGARSAALSSLFPAVWQTPDGRVRSSKCLVPAGAALVHLMSGVPLPGAGAMVSFDLENHTSYEWGFKTAMGKFTRFFSDKDQPRALPFVVDRQTGACVRTADGQIRAPLETVDQTHCIVIARRVPGAELAESIYRLTVGAACNGFALVLERDGMGQGIALDPEQSDGASLALDLIGGSDHRLEKMTFPRLLVSRDR